MAKLSREVGSGMLQGVIWTSAGISLPTWLCAGLSVFLDVRLKHWKDAGRVAVPASEVPVLAYYGLCHLVSSLEWNAEIYQALARGFKPSSQDRHRAILEYALDPS